ERLLIDETLLFVKEGDLLEFLDEKWVKTDQPTSDQLVRIHKVYPNRLEFEAWNLNDFYMFSISSEKCPPFPQNNFIKSARFRTKKQVSIEFATQRLLLKEKDLIGLKKGRWRILKRQVDGENFLPAKPDFQAYFYIDKFDKLGSNKFIRGFLLNPMRMKIEALSFPVASRKAKNQKRSKD
ncbi:MAG TPA: hypothetical protein P5048_04300, partial [Chlamydiales bacterium]|nr:hypothetical protein [Chlamydiales bacterium]